MPQLLSLTCIIFTYKFYAASYEFMNGYRKSSHDNKFQLFNALSNSKAISTLQCQHRCLVDSSCMSFFYHLNSTSCITHYDPFIYSSPPQSGPGWRFYRTKGGKHVIFTNCNITNYTPCSKLKLNKIMNFD